MHPYFNEDTQFPYECADEPQPPYDSEIEEAAKPSEMPESWDLIPY